MTVQSRVRIAPAAVRYYRRPGVATDGIVEDIHGEIAKVVFDGETAAANLDGQTDLPASYVRVADLEEVIVA
jgi:hypothetical protein